MSISSVAREGDGSTLAFVITTAGVSDPFATISAESNEAQTRQATRSSPQTTRWTKAQCRSQACDVNYSIQSNHLHLLVEARNRGALTRGVQGLMVRIAKGLNRLWSRRGKVFSDRYHDRILRSPRQVRNALVYVLQNAKKHGRKLKGLIDAFSSARWFDGWRERLHFTGPEPSPAPIAAARTWLLDQGWRKHGLISASEAPRSPG